MGSFFDEYRQGGQEGDGPFALRETLARREVAFPRTVERPVPPHVAAE